MVARVLMPVVGATLTVATGGATDILVHGMCVMRMVTMVLRLSESSRWHVGICLCMRDTAVRRLVTVGSRAALSLAMTRVFLMAGVRVEWTCVGVPVVLLLRLLLLVL